MPSLIECYATTMRTGFMSRKFEAVRKLTITGDHRGKIYSIGMR